jgi:hypothetical protein
MRLILEVIQLQDNKKKEAGDGVYRTVQGVFTA